MSQYKVQEYGLKLIQGINFDIKELNHRWDLKKILKESFLENKSKIIQRIKMIMID